MTLKEENLDTTMEETAPMEEAATTTTTDSAKVTRYYLHKVGGFDLLQTRPLILPKHQVLFVICKDNLRKYSLEDGSFFDEYNFGNKDKIVTVQVNEQIEEELLVAIEDGTIIIWNFVENIRRSQLFLPFKFTYFQAVKGHYYFTKNEYMACCPRNQLDQVMIVNRNHPIKVELRAKNIAFGPKDNIKYMVITFKNSMLVYEVPLRFGGRQFEFNLHHSKKTSLHFSCVDFHPTKPIIVTGDTLGRISIWTNFDTQLVRSSLSWHNREVADIIFSPSGTYIYSAGLESVVVQWNIVGEHFGRPNFLPRLGSAIKFLAIDKTNSVLVTSHVDQCMQIIDTQVNAVRAVIEGLCNGSGQDGRLTAGLHYNPSLRAIGLNGRVGHVQFYNPVQQRQLFQLDVTEQNVVSEVVIGTVKERLKNAKAHIRKIFPLEVTKVAIDDLGHWLATVEYRNDGETLPEIRLKFWQLKANSSKFFLNTNVQLPHQQEIIFIHFSPSNGDNNLHLVSGGKDKCFKVWDLLTNDAGRHYWNCTRTGTFNAATEPRMAAFTLDRSLLAVLFDVNTVTLWEMLEDQQQPPAINYIPRLNNFKSNLALKKSKKINYIGFGHTQAHQHLFIEVCDRFVFVSSIVQQFEPIFSFKCEHPVVEAMQSRYDNVLALRNRFGVEFLSLDTRQLVGKISLAASVHQKSEIIAAAFMPAYLLGKKRYRADQTRGMSNSTYYLINSKCQIFQSIVVDNNGEELDKFYDQDNVVVVSENSKTEIFVNKINRSQLSFMLEKKKINDETTGGDGGDGDQMSISLKAPASVAVGRRALIDTFFRDVPAHVLPPVAMFEESFMKAYALCLDAEPKGGETFEPNDENGDEEMETNQPRLKVTLAEDENQTTAEVVDKPRNLLDDIEAKVKTEDRPDQDVEKGIDFYWVSDMLQNMSVVN